MEDPKNAKDDKKENESPELKEELSEEVVEEVSGGLLGYGERLVLLTAWKTVRHKERPSYEQESLTLEEEDQMS